MVKLVSSDQVEIPVGKLPITPPPLHHSHD